jgi:CheY-like chemotaxis protein
MKMTQKTVLHIEDDPSLANLVKLTFQSFGFTGEFLQAARVEEAFNLLAERKSQKLPVDLILSDMHLPDGRGLDLLQNIKASPTWSKTPVIILSGDSSPEIVSEAYALGANCYLSKQPRKGSGLERFRSLYQFWIENALAPTPQFVSGIQEVLSKAIHLRARIAQFYIRLSGRSQNTPEHETFWLERAMIEGNLSSLILFLQGVIRHEDIPFELTEHLSKIQVKVEMALIRAEQIENSHPYTDKPGINSALLDLLEAWDEEAVFALFEIIFPLNRPVSEALKLRASTQLREITEHVLTEADDPQMMQRANLLRDFAVRFGKISAEFQGTE